MPMPSGRRAALLALLVALLLPAGASATTATLGSQLTTPPNVTWGCERAPTIDTSNFLGNIQFLPPGAADCTWRQQGVFGSTTDSRFSSVPGDGRITKVEVLTGANPAPLRFVIIRQLGNVGGTTNSQCCFFRSETEPFPLTPNAVNTINVSIPVERNTLNGIRAFDLVGISAAANTGALPLLEVGPHTLFGTQEPGAVDAGYFYPRLGSIPNDSGGGRPENGVSGLELTVRWTWVSADDPSLNPGTPVTPVQPVQPVQPIQPVQPLQPPPVLPVAPGLRSTSAQVRANRAAFALACGANAACAGRLQLLAATGALRTTATATAAAKKKPKKAVSYGTAKYTIKAGSKATVKVTLTKAAKALLKKRRSLPARLTLAPTGGAAVTKKVTLKR